MTRIDWLKTKHMMEVQIGHIFYFKINRLKGRIIYQGTVAKVVANGREMHQQNLKQELEREIEKLGLTECSELGFQGNLIAIYSDNLVKFVLRARMNQIPCNQLIRFWNKDHDKKCFLCNHYTESVAHLMNSCKRFKDLYSKRHDRVVDAVYQKNAPA